MWNIDEPQLIIVRRSHYQDKPLFPKQSRRREALPDGFLEQAVRIPGRGWPQGLAEGFLPGRQKAYCRFLALPSLCLCGDVCTLVEEESAAFFHLCVVEQACD